MHRNSLMSLPPQRKIKQISANQESIIEKEQSLDFYSFIYLPHAVLQKKKKKLATYVSHLIEFSM